MKGAGLAPLLVLAVGVAFVVAGCGATFTGNGGGSATTFRDPSLTPSANVAPGTADFEGWADCKSCHWGIYDDLRTPTANPGRRYHGGNFHDADSPPGEPPSEHGRDLIDGYGGACAACHTVGYDEPGGFNDGPIVTPGPLDNIQCEECHGPGGDHHGDPSKINRVPDAQETCWDCHVPSYKMLRGPVGPRVDADFVGTKPSSVGVHHPQATMIAGTYGYEYASRGVYPQGAHSDILNTCVTCHLQGNPVGPSGYLSHLPDDLHPDDNICAVCHAGGASDALEDLEHEVIELLIELGGEDPANPGHPDPDATGGALGAYASAHGIDLGDAATDNVYYRTYKGAKYNHSYVEHDASHGAHNPPYARALLEDSIAALQP
ncbi:MAG: multiheme c-type cytochrome [Armatimonadota bacterium]